MSARRSYRRELVLPIADAPAVVQRNCLELGIELPAFLSGFRIQRNNAVPRCTAHNTAASRGGCHDRGCLELARGQQRPTPFLSSGSDLPCDAQFGDIRPVWLGLFGESRAALVSTVVRPVGGGRRAGKKSPKHNQHTRTQSCGFHRYQIPACLICRGS